MQQKDVTSESDNYISYVATDNFKAGQLAGQYMAKLLDGKGNIALPRYAEGSDRTTILRNRSKMLY